MIKINVSRTCAEATQRERLTSGMQGVELSFSFSADWDDLVKTAVFEGSGRRIALTNIGDSCTIPHEVLAKHGGALRVGVYGRTADGSAATPTVYAQLGIIQRGADPNADPSTKPTLPVWAQILAKIGDLASLTTEDKTNLVAAINEAAKSGGGSGDGKDGTGIASITYKGKDEDGGNVYTVLLTDGTSYEITAPKGAKGDKGDTGAAGPQGPAGAPGKDGAGMDITGATVGQIAKITAVDSDGKPTAWSPVDMPTGGAGETWEKIAEIELRSDTAEYVLADFATWRKAKVIMTRPAYISGLSKNVWGKVVGQNGDDTYDCGYLTMAYGYVFWEFSAEVNDLFISTQALESNNTKSAVNVRSTGTFTPLKSPIEKYKFELVFTDTSVIQAGDKVTVIGVRR